VLALGVFADVEIGTNLADPASGVVPVEVRLSPSALHEVKLGGGIELDTVRAEWHLLTGWENRNFLGGLRRLTLELKPGAVLYPTRLTTKSDGFTLPKSYLLEGKARAELRQPGFLEARTQGVVQGSFNMYPVIFPPDDETALPACLKGALHDELGQPCWVLGYRDLGTSVGLERQFGPISSSLYYNFQTSFPFAYVAQEGFPYARIGDIPPTGGNEFKKVVVSYVQLTTNLDLRDDPLKPHRGAFIGNQFQVAGIPVTPNFRSGDPLFPYDLRWQPEVRGYIPIKRATLAMRFTTGFLFPANYGETFQNGGRISADDAQLIFFRGFFSGGPNSNRGYSFRGVGSKSPTPFFIPGITPVQDLATLESYCNDPMFPGRKDLLGCSFPTGGLTLWETSVEMRVPLALNGDLSGAIFCDASDVSRYRLNVRLLYPHLSCGVGAHYNTPVGPIRLDVGFPIPWLTVLDPSASDEEKTLDHILAVSIGIGEAF
jgi:outer membrane protein insertion porin family/translocation and assembly module TamA